MSFYLLDKKYYAGILNFSLVWNSNCYTHNRLLKQTQMKTFKTTALALGLSLLLAGTTIVRAQDYDDGYQDTYSNDADVSLQTFYDELSPYGTWIQDPQYGYVWRPDVDQSQFRPYYTEGRWAMTEYGNTWVSNYDWGWAPFHYGRWVYNNYRQWIWLPDSNWGPAWVNWRSGGGYYGWAPMGPSININIRFGRRYNLPTYCWNFIPQRSIYNNYYPRYNYGRNNIYINNTTIINNTYVYNRRTYYGGPSRYDIGRATNRNVTVYRVGRSDRPGASVINNNNVEIYRPRPSRGESNRNAAPNNYQRGSLATISNETSNRPERGSRTNNAATDRRNDVTNNGRGLDKNASRGAVTNGRPQRGVDNSNNAQQRDGNVMERNPKEQSGVSETTQYNGRPDRNSGVTDQRRSADAAQQQTQQRSQRYQDAQQQNRNVMERNPAEQSGVSAPVNQPSRTSSDVAANSQRTDAAQQEQQRARAQRSQESQKAAEQQRVQADQQRAMRAQHEQAVQAQRQEQAKQQSAQRAQQERAVQSQRQEQARQQQVERPQRVERVEAPRQQQAPQQRTERAPAGGRPSRGGR